MAKNFFEIGRLVLINYGPNEGKLATIVDVVDESYILVDGPEAKTGVTRQKLNLRRASLTNFKVSIGRGARQKALIKAWEKADIESKWPASAMAKKLAKRNKRQNLSDFDRFRTMLLRKKKSALVNKTFSELRKAANKK